VIATFLFGAVDHMGEKQRAPSTLLTQFRGEIYVKKLLLGIVGLVIALTVAAMVVPSFVDWNQYKAEIAAQAEAATGRKLDIRGDVSLGVLPSPALSVADVRLANAKEAATADMVQLKSLDVHVALFPLLSGRIQVTAVELVEPVIELERLADGRANWEFKPGGPAADPAVGQAGNGESGAGNGGGFGAIRVDRFAIERGTLVYRDTKAGTIERVTDINGSASLESLAGPIDTSGSAVVRGIPMSFDVLMGAVIQGRTVPLAVELRAIPGETKAKFNGALVNLAEAPGVKGNASVEGADLGALWRALTGGAAPALIAGRKFGLTAAVSGTAAAADIKDIELALDGMTARGNVHAAIGKTIDAEVKLAVGRVDLDKMLASTNPADKPEKPAPVSQDHRATATLAPTMKSDKADNFELPANINANVDVTVEAITYRKTAIRQARLAAALTNREITLSQFSALFPGGTDVAAFGFVTVPNGEPRFEGDVEVRTNDLRGALTALGIEVVNIPADRLHKLSLETSVSAAAGAVHAEKLKLVLDGTTVTGSARADLGARTSVTADVTVDKINLDGYLPVSAERVGGADNRPGSEGTMGRSASPEPAKAEELPFDADVKARIQSLTYRSIPVRELRVDGSFKDGRLTLRSASVENAAGVALTAKGVISGLGGHVLTLSNFTYDLRADDLTEAVQATEIDLSVSPRSLGKVSLSGTASGTSDALDVDAMLGAGGGEFAFAGALKPLDPAAPLDGRVAIRHPDVNQLVRTLGLAYKPRGQIGAVDAVARVVAGGQRIALTALDGTLGKSAIKGAVSADMSGDRPAVNADLGLGVFDVTPFLPAEQTASRAREPRIIPAAWRGGSLVQPAEIGSGMHLAAGAPWTNDPLDLSALSAADATLRVTAQALIYEKHRLDGAVVDAVLQNGVFEAKRFTGTLYGGNFAATARAADRGSDVDIGSRISLGGADLSQLMKALDQGTMDSGRLDFSADITGVGRSTAALVSRINGQGQAAITGARGGSKTFLAGILGLMGALNRVVPVIGNQTSNATDVSGTFQIVNGILTSRDMKLESAAGGGTALATVDLPAWTINANGEIKLASNLLSAILVDKTGISPALPFTVKGPLNEPNYNFDLAQLPGRSIRIPGMDRLRQTPGIGEVLDTLLPDGSKTQPAPAPAPGTSPQSSSGTLPTPPPPPTQQPPQQQQKPKDALKDLLRGLSK
jgi:uncharacterized protein involved in outer membrane biogenesis